MRTTRTGLYVLFSVLFAFPLLGQQNTETSSQALVLVQRAHAALAGMTTVSDVALTGTARRIAGSDDETGTATLKALATGEARMDLNFPSGQRSEIRANSENGPVGKWTGPDGQSHDTVQHNLIVDSAWFFPALMLRRVISSQDFVLAHVGPETRNERPVEHVNISQRFPKTSAPVATLMERLSRTEVYLDSSTLLPSVISFNMHPDKDASRDIPVEIRLSDYRSVNGAQVPFHVQRYANGGLVLDLQFETVTLNTGLTVSAFSL